MVFWFKIQLYGLPAFQAVWLLLWGSSMGSSFLQNIDEYLSEVLKLRRPQYKFLSMWYCGPYRWMRYSHHSHYCHICHFASSPIPLLQELGLYVWLCLNSSGLSCVCSCLSTSWNVLLFDIYSVFIFKKHVLVPILACFIHTVANTNWNLTLPPHMDVSTMSTTM